jgi:formamidopyrimidine-DNA glycosylase
MLFNLYDNSKMTEGPEASFLAEYIWKHFRGKRLRAIRILAGRYKTHGPGAGFTAFRKLLPMRLTQVYKKGKVLFLFFEDNWCLIAKMGMTGWFYSGKDRPLFDSEPHVVFEFDGDTLIFDDFRNFGTLTFTNNIMEIIQEMDRLAPDVLDPSTTDSVVLERVPSIRPHLPIEEVLMNQTMVMSGIGNILKSEILYDAGISPKRAIATLNPKDWHRILTSSKVISKRTLSVLQKRSENEKEEYVAIRKIYDKETDPEGNKVLSYRSGDGRTTFYVPALQK